MKKVLLWGTFLMFLFVSCEMLTSYESEPILESSAPTNFLEGNTGDIIPGKYIVVFNQNDQLDPTEKAREILGNLGLSLPAAVDHVYTHAIKGFSGTIPSAKLAALKEDPSVAYVAPDKIIKLNAPNLHPSGGISTRSVAQRIPWGILRVHNQVVPNNVETSSKRVWILDTGIDQDHPDLNIDVNMSYSIFSRGPDGEPDDKHGHGTHVAGTVAAINNGIDAVGVAPGAMVVAVKVLDRRGYGSDAGVVAGIDYVAANGSVDDVVNMSLGGDTSTAIDDAVKNTALLGIKFSLAAGNETEDANDHSPARAEGTNIYTISAFDSNDYFASFSNYGNPPIEYGQPGVNVFSLYKDGNVATGSGTSMAAPHFAGLLYLGSITTDGTVNGDPDGNADPIAVYNGILGGGNQAPIALYTYTVQDLTVTFTDASTDIDGQVTQWSWNFGDGNTSTIQNSIYTYATTGTYTVTLTVTDNEGATGITNQSITVSEPVTGDFAISAVGYKVKGRQKVDITWDNGSSNVIIYRDEVQVGTGGTSGTFTDHINSVGGGSYTYKVCDNIECITTVVTF